VRVVAALGGNALIAARALTALVRAGHDLVVTHGNGPQVGLLALQGAAYKPGETYPLDVLNAETEGMIGYLIEQELGNLLPADQPCATLLTQIEVDPADIAFSRPSKPIGPVYSKAKAEHLAAERRWSIARDGDGWRRVVASPLPKRIFEIGVIELLVAKGVVVICAGGGGIPVIIRPDGGLVGIEAVIDKDRASALLARQLGAEALLLLTDVAAVFTDWDTPQARCGLHGPQGRGGLRFREGDRRPRRHRSAGGRAGDPRTARRHDPHDRGRGNQMGGGISPAYSGIGLVSDKPNQQSVLLMKVEKQVL
jgi:carbamate kinase